MLCYTSDAQVMLCYQVSAEKKSVGSTAGMQTSVTTSDLFKHRAETVVPQRMEAMEKAIAERDFETFAKITMQVCLCTGYFVGRLSPTLFACLKYHSINCVIKEYLRSSHATII